MDRVLGDERQDRAKSHRSIDINHTHTHTDKTHNPPSKLVLGTLENQSVETGSTKGEAKLNREVQGSKSGGAGQISFPIQRQ